RTVLRLFQRVCEAAAFAHAHGVIHRDLKPENIMVGTFGEALLMDWGVAKAVRDAGGPPRTGAGRLRAADQGRGAGAAPEPGCCRPRFEGPAPSVTADGAVIGTPAYMAPEQARGEVQRIDVRADVYALGAILYFLLTGRSPFPPEEPGQALARVARESPLPPRRLDPRIPRALESIIRKAMAADATYRYASARD